MRIVDPDELAERELSPELSWSDENSGIVQGLFLDIDEAYFHCPRSMQFANLWDTATIEQNAQRSLKSLKED